MKALNKMDNMDKAALLSKLFPQELQNIQNAIQKQCDYFLKNENTFRNGWHQRGFFTAGFWYSLVQNAHTAVQKNEGKLWQRPHWFVDHFFDGHNSLFAIHSLVEYADDEHCDPQLKQAIHLLFGNEKLLQITLNEN